MEQKYQRCVRCRSSPLHPTDRCTATSLRGTRVANPPQVGPGSGEGSSHCPEHFACNRGREVIFTLMNAGHMMVCVFRCVCVQLQNWVFGCACVRACASNAVLLQCSSSVLCGHDLRHIKLRTLQVCSEHLSPWEHQDTVSGHGLCTGLYVCVAGSGRAGSVGGSRPREERLSGRGEPSLPPPCANAARPGASCPASGPHCVRPGSGRNVAQERGGSKGPLDQLRCSIELKQVTQRVHAQDSHGVAQRVCQRSGKRQDAVGTDTQGRCASRGGVRGFSAGPSVGL